jgi:hypothetical protein
MTGGSADLAEWSYHAGDMRITRCVALLRGRRMALISVLAESHSPGALNAPVRWSLPPKVAVKPLADRRAFVLTAGNKWGSVHVLPIGLPCLAYATDRGRFEAEGRELALHQNVAGRRCWLPLLVSWDPPRHRKTVTWRVLTVAERSRITRSDRAVAVRVSWGRDESYVIYRSLGPPAHRTFLGHHTRARFLIAQFTTEGDVKPILTVD